MGGGDGVVNAHKLFDRMPEKMILVYANAMDGCSCGTYGLHAFLLH